MKTTKQNVIAQVQNSVSSIFSKEDVINLINSIQADRVITTRDIERAIDSVVSNFEMNNQDVVELHTAEFNIGYNNQLEVDNVGLNLDYIREALENQFMDFGEVENDEEVDLNKI